jgi:hypothetical protein
VKSIIYLSAFPQKELKTKKEGQGGDGVGVTEKGLWSGVNLAK